MPIGKESRETWGQMASGWEDRREWMMEVTGRVNSWLAEKADPRPSQTILDVAAGTGDLGFLAAERVGEEGPSISTDFAPEMVDVARRQGESRGLTNVEYRELDAERMDLEDDSVDGVVSRWGYMLMADPAAALKETRRVLRDGGPLAFAVWSSPHRQSLGGGARDNARPAGSHASARARNAGVFVHGRRRPNPRARHRSRLR